MPAMSKLSRPRIGIVAAAFSVLLWGRSLQKRKRKGRCPLQSVDICPLLVPLPGRVLLVERSRQLTSLDRSESWPCRQTGRPVGIGLFFALTYLAVSVMHFIALKLGGSLSVMAWRCCFLAILGHWALISLASDRNGCLPCHGSHFGHGTTDQRQ